MTVDYESLSKSDKIQKLVESLCLTSLVYKLERITLLHSENTLSPHYFTLKVDSTMIMH